MKLALSSKLNAELSIPEVAETMGISASTVKRAWILAKAFLRRELEENG
jgi:DNA-directed RNA polymerase specialized sigma24 family protein